MINFDPVTGFVVLPDVKDPETVTSEHDSVAQALDELAKSTDSNNMATAGMYPEIKLKDKSAQLEAIKVILRDSGCDSMQQIRTLDRIAEVL